MEALADQLNIAQKSSSGLHLATLELKRLLAAQPDLYSCEGGLTTKIHQLLLAPTRKDIAVERLYSLFAQLLVPGVVAKAESNGDDNNQDEDEDDASTNDAYATLCLLELLKCCNAGDKNARLHACRLAAEILDAVATDDNTEISSVPWDALRLALLPRLRDKVSAIRAAAATAFRHIQDSDDPKDEATSDLIRIAHGDSAKEVRISATKSFNLTHATLPVLLANTRDSAYEVRVAAIERLGREVAAETLSNSQRAALVTRALSDRHPAVMAQGKWLVVQCWLKRCSWDPLQVLNLMDCDGLENIDNAYNDVGDSPASLVAHTILDVFDDFDAPAKGFADYSFTSTPEDRDLLDQLLEQHASKIRSDAKLARNAAEDDEYAHNPPTAAALLLLRLRAERIHKNMSGRGGDAVARDAALEALLPEPAAFADLLAACLRAATRAAANAETEANELDDAETRAELSGKGPYSGCLVQTAKVAEDEATIRLSAALQALKLVTVLDRQEESGRVALISGISGAALSDLMPDEIVEASIEALAALNGGPDRSYATNCLKLMSECASNAADVGSTSSNSSISNAGETTTDIEEQTEMSEFWNLRLVVIAAEALKHLTAAALAPWASQELSIDDDDDEDIEDEKVSAAECVCLVSAFEGPLAMLLATGTDPGMRERVMIGLGRLSLVDEKTALKYLPALVNASVTALEQLPVRAAAFQAITDIALLFDSAATALRDPKNFMDLPGVAIFCEEDSSTPAAGGNFVVGMIKTLLCCANDDGNCHLTSMVSLVAEGAAKLILSKRLISVQSSEGTCTQDEEVATVLDALLVAYFNPPKMKDDNESTDSGKINVMSDLEAAKALGSMARMQQVLSVFFPAFATAISTVTAPQDNADKIHGVGICCLRGALRSLLGRYCQAASDAGNADGKDEETAWSPLGAVPVSRVILFIVSLLDLSDAGSKKKSPASATDEDHKDDNETSRLADKENLSTNEHIYAAIDICYALLSIQPTAASNGNGVATARKSLGKVLGILDPPSGLIDIDNLKLVTELSSGAAAVVTRNEGTAAAKPIRKFAEACKLADLWPERSLPSERRAESRNEYLRFAAAGAGILEGSDEMSILADALSSLEESDQENNETDRRSTAQRVHSSRKGSLRGESTNGDDTCDEGADKNADEEEQKTENVSGADEKSIKEKMVSQKSIRATRSTKNKTRAALANAN